MPGAQRVQLLRGRVVVVEVVHLAALWSSPTPEFASLTDGIPRERRRQVVTDAVTAVLAQS